MAPPFDAGSTSPTDGALKRPDARAADGGEPAHGGEGGSGRDASMPKDATVPKDVFASNDVFVPKDVFAPDDAPVAKDSFVAEAAAPHDAGHDAVSNPCNPGDSLCGGACVDEQTNDANCGGCGLSCSTTCTVGECVVVLASWGSETTPGLGVSSTDVYWASAIDGGESGTVAGANGRILTVPIGGGVTTTLASGQPVCGHLTVHGEIAYWNTSAIGSETTGAIVSAPLATGNPSTIVSIPLHANSIAADDAYVYWMNAGLMKASLDGLTVTTLVPSTGGANDLVLSTTNAFWTSGNFVMTATPTHCPPLHALPQLFRHCWLQLPSGVQTAGHSPPVHASPQLSRHWALQVPFDVQVCTHWPPVHALPQLSRHCALQVPSGVHACAHWPPAHALPQLSTHSLLQVPSGVHTLAHWPPAHALPQLSTHCALQLPSGVHAWAHWPPAHALPQLSLHCALQPPSGVHAWVH